MAFWLASRRDGQDSDFIQRFDPRFWTVDFPRPAMASVVSTGPDSLRVDCEIHHTDSLIGLIWESADRFDHPLLAYATQRDYARTTLSFRWRSAGLVGLDAVHGPTLTIEGRDAAGAPRTWYVRIWSYAVGSPTDAQVTLPFSQLREGWLADGSLIHPGDIDRMFLSLVAPGHAPASHSLLPARADGWVEMSAIHCDGHRAMLPIGDVLVPPHDIGMATAYDDSYNLTPARLLRMVLGLGYRGAIIHYVGMSHYFRLAPQAGGFAGGATGGVVRAMRGLARCLSGGMRAARLPADPLALLRIVRRKLPADWAQRAFDGSQALTGWVPPSTLLSPANAQAMGWLQDVGAAFTALAVLAGLAGAFPDR